MRCDTFQQSEKCMLISVDLVGMTTEHFEMSSFPLPESICYFLYTVSELLLHKNFQVFFLQLCMEQVTPIWAQVVLGTEKAMATHSSTLAWKTPWTEEPGRLQSMGSLRVGHDWATSLSLFTFMLWRRTWQRTPVFLPGESQGRGSLVVCRLWGCTELDMTEVT